jgi:putative membrane protein
MKNLLFLLLGLIILFFGMACQNEHGKNYDDATKVDQDGLSLIKNGLEGGMAEIKASGLAITNSSNQRVISFAKMMIEDHTKADSILKTMKTDKLVEEKDTISIDHQKMISSLSKQSGPEFDKAYMQMMVTDHQGAVQLFTDGSKNTDGKISDFATKTLPTIKMHLDSATAILASLK